MPLGGHIIELRRSVVERTPRLWAVWAASRPSQLLLIGLLYLLGIGMAVAGGWFGTGDVSWSGVTDSVTTLLSGGIVLLVVSMTIHYANEYADFDTDRLADRTPFSGGSGALVVTGLPVSFLKMVTVVSFVLSLGLIGLLTTISLLHLEMVVIALFGLVLGVAYSLPPTQFIRRGVGEVINLTLGGILVPLYGFATLATPNFYALLVLVPFSLIVGCNLLAVHWPDRSPDRTVGKRTLAVTLQPRELRRLYAVIAIVAIAVAVGMWVAGKLPFSVLGAHLLVLPLLIWGWHTLTRWHNPFPSVAAMVSLAIGMTIAWWGVALGI